MFSVKLLSTTARSRFILVFIAMLSPLILHLPGCAHGIDDVSKPPPPAAKPNPTVNAQLSSELKTVLAKYPQLRATLFLDNTSTSGEAMTINASAAIWQQGDLKITNPYSVNVLFDLELPANSGNFLTLARATTVSHDFSAQPTLVFKPEDFISATFDDDKDTMDNLAELVIGGNPNNPAPTITSPAQVTVLEFNKTVLTVTAIAPASNATLSFSLTGGTNKDLFTIDSAGVLGFQDPVPLYIQNGNNDYNVEVSVSYNGYSSSQIITVNITDIFDLKVSGGLKQLQFSWLGYPGATYYKLREFPGSGIGNSKELKNSSGGAQLMGDHYVYDISVHHLDPANTYQLEAYGSADNMLTTTAPISISTGQLLDTIGYFKAFKPYSDSAFGYSLDLSKDGRTLVVGSLGVNGNKDSVQIFRYSKDGNWQVEVTISAENTEAGDSFGKSVSLSADGSTLAVGAFFESSDAKGVISSTGWLSADNNNANSAGAVYIFERNSAGTWLQTAYIKAGNSEAGDHFGGSVSLSANGGTLAVGAFFEASNANGVYNIASWDTVYNNNNADWAGAVYVFERDISGGWPSATQTAYIKASNPDSLDRFGFAISLSADGGTLAIGASGEASICGGVNPEPTSPIPDCQFDNSASAAGAVYIFEKTVAGNWSNATQTAYIKASNAEEFDWFGSNVSLSADGSTLAVGAFAEDSAARGVNPGPTGTIPDSQLDNSASAAGAVYIFERDISGGWPNATQTAYIKAANAEALDHFSAAISLSADSSTLAVGANGEGSTAQGVFHSTSWDSEDNNDAPGAGAVYIFKRDTAGAGWTLATQTAYVKAKNTEQSDTFGGASSTPFVHYNGISLSFDGSILAVGAPLEDSAAGGINPPPSSATTGGPLDNSAQSAGAVYLY